MDPAASTRPPDPELSPEDVLRAAVEAHAEAETSSIAAYRELSSRLPDTLAALVLRMILADEEHHHTALRGAARMLEMEALTRPQPSSNRVSLSSGDQQALEAAIGEEIKGASQLRSLAQANPEVCEGIMALLLELMAQDSEKHAYMLRFVLSRLQG
jgi:hypothetical protein